MFLIRTKKKLWNYLNNLNLFKLLLIQPHFQQCNDYDLKIQFKKNLATHKITKNRIDGENL